VKRAVISDIHANLAAFEAVLEHIEKQSVDEIYCLGDVIGYGPDPIACIELATRFPVNLLGNHEDAVLFKPLGFNPKAKLAIEWTKNQLNHKSLSEDKKRELWTFISDLERIHQEGSFLFVHGSPREPIREYIFKQDYQDRRKMDEIFAAPPDVAWKVCFAGHTHHPGIFTQTHPYAFHEPGELGGVFRHCAVDHKILVNVGSVGQPRDGDWRSSYVIVDDEEIRFHRLEYDVQRTIRRFKEFPELPEYLAKRLEDGK
jgi:predicted phosphodiesterase